MNVIYRSLFFTFVLLFAGCTNGTPKAFFCVSSHHGYISIDKQLKQSYLLSMEGVDSAVVYLNNKTKTGRKFGRVTMAQFLSLYDANDQFDELALPITFCYVDQKTGTARQFESVAFSPSFNRENNTLVWKLSESKGLNISKEFGQNVIVLNLNLKDAEYLFHNAFSYD